MWLVWPIWTFLRHPWARKKINDFLFPKQKNYLKSQKTLYDKNLSNTSQKCFWLRFYCWKKKPSRLSIKDKSVLLQKKSNKVSLYIFEKAISLNTGQVAGFGLKTLDYSFLSNTNKKYFQICVFSLSFELLA